MAIEIPNDQRRAIVDELTGAGNLLDGVTIDLFQNDVIPGPGSVLADFDVATFSGYAQSTAVVWGPAFSNSVNEAVTVGDVKQFNSSGPGITNVIYGYFVTGGGDLIYAERFSAPLPVLDVGYSVVVVPTFSFGQ